MKLLSCTSLMAIGLALASMGAQAQTEQAGTGQNNTHTSDITTLSEWSYNPIYESEGIRSEYLLDIEIFGPEGDEIGNVEDAVILQGRIVAIIAEVGGFWDIGDVHIAVPWKDVEVVVDGLSVPVSEGNFEQYALYHDSSYVNQGYLQRIQRGFGLGAPQGAAIGKICASATDMSDTASGAGDEGMDSHSCAWRLTALVDDYVVLENGTGYGYLDDVIFAQDGEIQAIIVEPTVETYGYGAYAYPFNGYAAGWAWYPYNSVYRLPYGADEIDSLPPFQYDMYHGFWY